METTFLKEFQPLIRRGPLLFTWPGSQERWRLAPLGFQNPIGAGGPSPPAVHHPQGEPPHHQRQKVCVWQEHSVFPRSYCLIRQHFSSP